MLLLLGIREAATVCRQNAQYNDAIPIKYVSVGDSENKHDVSFSGASDFYSECQKP